MAKLWRPMPLPPLILDIVKKTGGCTDEELLRNLKKETGEVDTSTLNKTLLAMEVRGLIHVSAAPKGKKKIELA